MVTYQIITTILLYCVVHLPDSPEYVIPDDFPVTDKMIYECAEGNIEKNILPSNKTMFKNKELNEALIFELYAYNHRLTIINSKIDFLFSDFMMNQNIPLLIPADIRLFQIFQDLLNNSCEIDKDFFKSNHGIVLGSNKDNIISIYGKPNNDTIIENIEILEWDYTGELLLSETGQEVKGRIAEDSWGYHLTMYIKNEQLAAMIIFNDIP